MIKIKETIIVEGRYDKIKLSQLVDANIIITDGFKIFKDKDKINLIKKIAMRTGIIVLTDSDRAGFIIRNYLKQCIPSQYIKHAYIPEIKGKERRKPYASKEGIMGVEGIDDITIIQALKKSGCNICKDKETINSAINISKQDKIITKTDLYNHGVSGKADSKRLREYLTQAIGLPKKISTNSLLQALNIIYTYHVSDTLKVPHDFS